MWDQLVAERGSAFVGDEGGLLGPFNAVLYSPAITGPIAATGDLLRAETVLDRRLLELAAVVVLGHWRAEFAFDGHAANAIRYGIDEAVIEAIVAGAEPRLEDEDDFLVHAIARELVRTGHVTDDLYPRVVARLGERAVVELVTAVGFYSFIAFTLNAFDVDPVPGRVRRWPHQPE